MNEQRFNYADCENRSDYSYDTKWETIDWERANEYVNRLQLRIVKAVGNGNWNLVKRLQYLLTHSFYARALAVKKATGNKGGKTSGVDKVLWTTKRQKYKAVMDLKTEGYKAKPTRRVYIEKSNGKLRPLSIPTVIAKCTKTQ